MKILVINAGSSSLKYQLMDMSDGSVMAKGLCERIGIDGNLKHEAKGEKHEAQTEMKNHSEALKIVLDMLVSKDKGVIDSLDEIAAAGHRVAHGGEFFASSQLITPEVEKAIEKCIELAPLHNPANLMGIHACREIMGDIPQVAVFDTAFHQTMPEEAYFYALPYEYYTEHKIRRYGFHGTSHMYVGKQAAEMLGKKFEEVKIITCHLGNGSSIDAIKNGKSVDTTMGFTPLEGMMMGTRSGSFDPAIITYMMDKTGIDAKGMNDVMNKKSGAFGISGVSSDFRDIEGAAEKGNKRAALALSMFCYQAKKFIGAYAAAMGGVDAIVFTAGIGENSADFRMRMTEGLEYMGVSVDAELNKQRGKALDISKADAKTRVLVIPTNEELVIATDTKNIVSK